jgi:multidrug resistance efflux pump
MVAALLMTAVAGFAFWLVFFKFRWLRLTFAWGFIFLFFVLHLALVFLIGMRFVAPYSTDVTIIQHTIQLIPRLPEPTLVTAVLVKPNVPVKKGEPLFQFDRRPYEYKVKQIEAQLAKAKQDVLVMKADVDMAAEKVTRLEAQLAKAKQDVLVMKADVDVAAEKVAKAQGELAYAQYKEQLARGLAEKGAGPEEEAQKSNAQLKIAEAALKEAQADLVRARLRYESEIGGVNTTVASAEAALKEAQADLVRARLRYESEIGGVNTTVASIQADLDQARYYLDNTTMVAPEDGFITNLQVVPGMVAGIVRFGAIATFIVDAGRYVLGAYYQEQLKYVKKGQPVEIAIDLYPGQIFEGKVESIWWASGQGQLLPSGELPSFKPPPEVLQGRFAVMITLDDEKQANFPIGAQGAAAIYTGGGGFAAMRRIVIRTYTWLNWLYPIPF